jgi:hypothetical protein
MQIKSISSRLFTMTTMTTTMSTITMKSFFLLLLLFSPTLVNSKYHANAMEEFWIDPSHIADSLDLYEGFYIEPHSCVWSECAVDDTDDGYTGDNRDGDEQWYQFRTQEFCANAAYSLYGVKKGETYMWGCTRGHFINSFFTYGGADNLLKSVGIEPIVYYSNASAYYDDADENAYYGDETNEQCVALDDDDYDEDEDEDEDNNNQQSGSGDQDNNGWSSTLGCSSEGDYVIVSFDANTCDGNYFYDIIDTFRLYNKQHGDMGCHHIWSSKDASTDVNIQFLMNNSWTCDLDLYPNGCPDPFGKKARFDFALRTVANGGNAKLAYKNMMWKRPLRVISWVFVGLVVLMIGLSYYFRNIGRMRAKGGCVKGYFGCVWEDFVDILKGLYVLIKLQWNAMILSLGKKTSGDGKVSSKKKKKSRKKKKEAAAAAADDTTTTADEKVASTDYVGETAAATEDKTATNEKKGGDAYVMMADHDDNDDTNSTTREIV